ncbi:MAG: heme biosynthesis protein HemY, partial [Rhodospirillales bacterium]|nr:heme biosynthesis protein HemY [Rhodospirillales bacterium]
MMRRLLGFLVLAALILGAAWFVAELPGSVTARLGGTTIEASSPVAALLALILFAAAYLLLRLLAGLIRLPRRLRAWRGARHRRLGDIAATRAMVALAAGEHDDARAEAARARRMLGETAHTLLLTAQAARLSGRHAEAETALHALTQKPETAFLGFRGLLRR